MNNLTRDDISEYIYKEFGLSKKDCNNIVNELIEEIITGLINNGYFKLHNFGTFKLREKKERIGRNPKTKEEVMISQRNVEKFKPSESQVNQANSNLKKQRLKKKRLKLNNQRGF